MDRKIRVLVACEFSGIVREAFAKRGFDAWSCDLLPTEIPGQHIQGDVLKILNDGWDLMIAHPPCTHLSKAGGWCWKFKAEEQEAALRFVRYLMDAPIKHIAIENPVGKINTAIRPPDQIIHPYFFGDPWLKETCLWLKNMPKLEYSKTDNMFWNMTAIEPKGNWVKPGNKRLRRFNDVPEGGHGNPKDRSRSFPGVADAMAEQWGSFIKGNG